MMEPSGTRASAGRDLVQALRTPYDDYAVAQRRRWKRAWLAYEHTTALSTSVEGPALDAIAPGVVALDLASVVRTRRHPRSTAASLSAHEVDSLRVWCTDASRLLLDQAARRATSLIGTGSDGASDSGSGAVGKPASAGAAAFPSGPERRISAGAGDGGGTAVTDSIDDDSEEDAALLVVVPTPRTESEARPFSLKRVTGAPLSAASPAAHRSLEALAELLDAAQSAGEDARVTAQRVCGDGALCQRSCAEALLRLYDVSRSRGRVTFPEPMLAKMAATSRSIPEFQDQTVLAVRNRWTHECMLFNPIRAQRPGVGVADSDVETLHGLIDSVKGAGCDFCDPESFTGYESWGRIESDHCITCANMCKYTGLHGLVLARQHNPLLMTEAATLDMLRTANAWLRKAAIHCPSPDRVERWCPHIMWDSLPRGGASQVHTHMQVSLRPDYYFARWEAQRGAAATYTAATGGRNYWSDLAAAHDAAGCAVTAGEAVAFTSLTPPVGFEVIVVCASADSPDFARMFVAVLDALRRAVGTTAYSISIAMPALNVVPAGSTEPPSRADDPLRMPVIARICDRGDPESVVSDVSANELYGSPVISKEPVWLAAQIARELPASMRP